MPPYDEKALRPQACGDAIEHDALDRLAEIRERGVTAEDEIERARRWLDPNAPVRS